MKVKTVSSTEAVRNFGELISQVKHGRKEIVIEKAGEPMARIVPCESATMTLREFVDYWKSSGDGSFADDLEKVQRADEPATLEAVS
jgi:prevent-host-death family protein